MNGTRLKEAKSNWKQIHKQRDMFLLPFIADHKKGGKKWNLHELMDEISLKCTSLGPIQYIMLHKHHRLSEVRTVHSSSSFPKCTLFRYILKFR